MTALFLKLLDMSLSASWLVLAVMAARLLLKKAPKSIRCVLWALVALRLLCPFTLESKLSLVPASYSRPVEIVTSTIQSQPAELPAATVPAEAGAGKLKTERYVYTTTPAADGTMKIVGPAEDTEAAGSWLRHCGILWAAGMSAMLAYALWSCRRIWKKVVASIDIGGGVRICDYIDSPFILGILRPKIYLPSALNPESAGYVLAHERAHLKRRDHWWKPLGYVLLSVYWFNPLLWAAYILLCRDIELACDERVIRDMGSLDKKAYSEALLSCSVPRRMIAACPLAFGEVGVKERVKSVLHYKKPAFWIIVIAVVLCIVVAVCFLTDPMALTLTQLGDVDAGQAICVELRTRKGVSWLTNSRDLPIALNALESTTRSSTPVSDEAYESEVDENGWAYDTLQVGYEDDTAVTYYFDENYTIVWASGPEGTTLPYSVENPGLLQELFTEYVDPVKNRITTLEPFAAIDEGWQWTKGIVFDAIQTALLQITGEDADSLTAMRRSRVEALLDVLNSLPQDALTEGAYMEEYVLNDLLESCPVTTTAVLCDAANDITALIISHDDALELVLCNGADVVSARFQTYSGAQCYRIQSEALAELMEELRAYPVDTNISAGCNYDWQEERLSVSHANAAISAYALKDWTYEIVNYSEGAESFGIRFRPASESEGWVYFSFWPEGYEAVEEDRHYEISFDDNYPLKVSWPKEVSEGGGFSAEGCAYSYSRLRYSIGDYVVLNDGADNWFAEYSDQIWCLYFYSSFSYGTPGKDRDIRVYGDVTVDFSNAAVLENGESRYPSSMLYYFDWDAIAAEMDAEEVILFDPQLYGSTLFVGCQSGTEYAIAVFRCVEQGGCQLITLLHSYDIRTRTYDDQTKLIYADYTVGNTNLHIYLLNNETITAFYYYGSDGTDYALLDRCPALVILPAAEDGSFPAPTLYYEEPISFCHYGPWSYGGNELQFSGDPGENAALWKTEYIAANMFSFHEEKNWFRYALTHEELLEFRAILIDIPKTDIHAVTSQTDTDPVSSLLLSCGDGIFAAEEGCTFNLDYTGENVIMTIQKTTGGAEYTYAITNEALNAFMSGLRDTDRESLYTPSPYFSDYVQVTCEAVSVRLPRFVGWIFEEVPYTDGAESFGIRCRPEEAASGWLYFSFWPRGYAPVEDNRRYSTNGVWSTGYHDHIASYPQEESRIWSNIRYSRDIGEFAIINDGAEDWFLDYQDEISILQLFAEFTGGEPIEITYPPVTTTHPE